MHPLVQDDLSRITEGSWEGGSVASSYFSAVSNTASTSTLNAKDRRLLAAAGASQAPAARAEAEVLRRTVKAFVELGVRGRRVEALRRDRQAQPVLFRLSRHVDAFEIVPEGGRASQRVHLGEVAGVYMGDDGRLPRELAASLVGLDGRCAVVDFRDGRCLALRFAPDRGEEAEGAAAFARCMQIFVQEVQRERAKQPAALK